MKLPMLRWQRWLLFCVLFVFLLGGGYYGTRHVAWPAFKTWRLERMNRDAAAFLERRDYANAMLIARKSLKASVQNPTAWRIAAAAAKARDLPEAVGYQESLSRQVPTKENYLELIRLALHFEAPGYALDAIKAMAGNSRDDPEFHRLAADVYRRTGQLISAKYHLVALVHLQPADRTAALDLAEIELAADPERKDRELRARVLALADEAPLRLRALSLLLRDALTRPLSAAAGELVNRLALELGLGVEERLLVVQGLFALDRPAAGPALSQLQAEVIAQPAEIARVLGFLNRTGRAADGRAWVATLPEAMRRTEEVQSEEAELLLTLGDAPALEALLRGNRWSKREFLRAALLAHAYRDQGKTQDFAEAWRLALIDAGTDLRKAAALLGRVDEWRWLAERPAVVWKLFGLVPANVSVQQALIVWERLQGNTPNLNRLFARIVEVQPTDTDARNNLSYTSLLLDANLARVGLAAAQLSAAHPNNPYYKTTHALALSKQGQWAEALARLDTLTATERTEPVRMVLRAHCLAALGQAGPAADLINGVTLEGMLPEEKRLADGVRVTLARLDQTRGNRSRLQGSRAGQEFTASPVGWLTLVAAATRRAATPEMQLADTLYAAPDWDGLGTLLQTSEWEANNYLRVALQAYVFRQQDNPRKSQEQWRQSLAMGDRHEERLANLRALATHWQWTPERVETLNLIFERRPTDERLLAELLEYYAGVRRTADLQRVLGTYLADTTELTEEAVRHAYYSLLIDRNVARAHVVARRAFEAKPADVVRRMVYVFSLWKQQRAPEAMPLLAEVPAGATGAWLPIPLLRATVLAQLGAKATARASLAEFSGATALPEEVALAARIGAQLSAQAQTM